MAGVSRMTARKLLAELAPAFGIEQRMLTQVLPSASQDFARRVSNAAALNLGLGWSEGRHGSAGLVPCHPDATSADQLDPLR